MSKNRIAKYIREMKPTMAQVVIVSDIAKERVTLSIKGEILVWHWQQDGLFCPGASKGILVHPIAAEAIIIDEVEEFLGLEGVGEDEVVYIDVSGHKLEGIYLHPKCLGEPTYKVILAKEKMKELYANYQERGRKITEDLIGQAISFGILGAFLSLVNL